MKMRHSSLDFNSSRFLLCEQQFPGSWSWRIIDWRSVPTTRTDGPWTTRRGVEDSHSKLLNQESTVSPMSTHSNLPWVEGIVIHRKARPSSQDFYSSRFEGFTFMWTTMNLAWYYSFENLPQVAFKCHSPTEDEAMADPHPKVLKQESTIFPVFSSTRIWSFMTSPQAGAPTSPVPTLGSSLSKLPTLRGLL